MTEEKKDGKITDKHILICGALLVVMVFVGALIENNNNKNREHAIEMLKMRVIEKCAANGGKDAK